MRVLVTRAEEDAQRTAAALAARGHAAILAPLRRRVLIDSVWPTGPFAAVLATSRHAFAGTAAPDHLRTLPCFCVGAATADAARAAGFAAARASEGDGAALAQAVIAQLPAGAPLLYLAGEPRHGALEAALTQAGHPVTLVTRYAMRRADALPEAARAALESGSVEAVLHYSAESARAFLALAEAADVLPAALRLEHLCLSEAVAAQFPPGTPAKVAPTPDEAALLDQLGTPGCGSAK